MYKNITHWDANTRLLVFTTSSTGANNYFYSCPQAPEGFGPFNNQQDAIQHYNSMMQSVVAVFPTPAPTFGPEGKNNVIHVDFRAKKRVV